MSDDLVPEFIVAVAVMFLGLVVTPMLGGRRGRIFSLLLFFGLIILAFKWSSLKNHIAAPLNAFLISTASSGYVWTGMLVTTWLYLAVDSLFAPYRGARPTRTKPSPLDRLVNFFAPKLPESLASDREYLIKELTPFSPEFSKYKAQIFYGPSDRCVSLANELSEILKAAKWEQVNVPMPIPHDAKARRGFSVRSSTTSPAYSTGLKLQVTLSEIGIDAWTRETPDLRQFDYCFVYIAE